MIESLGTAASALQAHQQRMDALANDVANVNTNGYRSVSASGSSGGPSTAQGALIATANPLDLAVEGDGWFQVARPGAQPALTRAGVFQVDASGQIVTDAGERLVPPVQLPPGAGATSVRIEQDGSVISGGARVAQIQLFHVAAPSALQAIGGGRYVPTTQSGPATPAAPPAAAIRQGTLESSNTDLADTTAGTVETRTGFAAAARVLHVQDAMLGALLDLRR
jgi:flagellar basal-body rod protein FlgG